MPLKDRIELGSGRLYFKGVDEPVEVCAGDMIFTDEEYADQVKYISLNPEPFTFECEAEFNRDWTLVECKECGYKFPVTELYALLYGPVGWTCPTCTLKKALEDARQRSKL